uniref:Uncharacterized protein n=1 Tax=Kalanchoe fedtschenkoi TaxID=63787 RepID=A0A7N0V992_KALFE
MICLLSSLSIFNPLLPPSLPKLKCSSIFHKQSLGPSCTKACKSHLQSQTHAHTNKQQLQQLGFNKSSLLVIQVGALLATAEQPALAITGVNNQEDFTWVLIQLGISAFLYFLVVPPFIMNWLRLRWYKRNLIEMYLQFMCVFIFFPGMYIG